LLLYWVQYQLLLAVAQVLLRPAMHRLAHTLWQSLVREAAVAICAVLPALVMSRLERRPPGAYGLPKRGAFGKNFAWGVLWGFGAMSLLLLTLRALHVFYFGPLAEHGERAVEFALFWAFFFLLVAIYEEFLFRGYTQFTLARRIGFWPSAVVLSAVFAYQHLGNPGENWIGLLGVALVGMFCCFTLLRTGTLWFALGLHASWDWAQSYFYGVPDSGGMSPGHLLNSSSQGPAWLSGGSVGPEGSVLVLVVIAAMFVMFHFAFPEKSGDRSGNEIPGGMETC
jgi:membrane protease YdiL (CAAX protease family)